MRRGLAFAIAAIAVAGTLGSGARAESSTEDCIRAKLAAAGREIKKQMNCIARASRKLVPVDPDCFARAEAQFAEALQRADANGSCPGTVSEIQPLLDDCRSALAASVGGLYHCGSTARIALGAAARCELKCAGKDFTDPGTLATCHVPCDDHFAVAFYRGGGCGQSLTAQATIHTWCRDNVVAGFTATTTTTSSTTSTTL